MADITKKYPDTEEGAKECLEDQSVLKVTEETEVIPDLVVEGVWKLTNMKSPESKKLVSAIVYMAGYPEIPHSKTIRKYNDFLVLD